MKPYLLILAGVLFPVLLLAQTDIKPIPNWKMELNSGVYKFTPPGLTGQTNFEYDIMPLQKNDGINLADWLKTAAANDLSKLGYSGIKQGTVQQVKNSQSLLTYTLEANNQSGTRIAVIYFAFQKPDHIVRFGKIIRLPQYKGNYINVAATHFVTLIMQEKTPATENAASPENSAANDQKSTTTGQKTTSVKNTGKGITAAEIKGVLLHSETRLGVGGMLIFVYFPYLLLKNSSMYEHLGVSPADINEAESRQSEPTKWGTWQLDGKALIVTHRNKDGSMTQPNRWTGWSWASPAKPNEKLTGTYGSISGGGNTAVGGGSMVVSSKYITFNNQGQFTYESIGGGSYNGSTGSVTAYSSKDRAGTYTLDGYSIELRFNNGQVSRQSFYFYDDKDHAVIGIGNSPYTSSK
ncbi:hypothetical protein [Mucilaginibacter aquaedulcis]|uniref:hypothetical protein n=1 Tax=Mucilaginibacter aquaedulcis TaxID=1187081 RepID=UPI0025B49C38|nr:hypothetical protein [Mucilaginibacter aquaedulcis]MDN3548478.1 hypothetical protein [Mucilaginibacter aquaedulcis]